MNRVVDKILYYMFFCHRLPERSFFYKGKQFPICARCTGILVGYVVGIIGVLLFERTPHLIPLLSALTLFLPLIIDGVGQLYGYWVSTNRRRFITGILGGIALIYYIRLLIWGADLLAQYCLDCILK